MESGLKLTLTFPELKTQGFYASFYKKWRIGGDVHAPMENKLKFLMRLEGKEQVGMYLRNQNIRDESFDDQYKKRAECEKIHGNITGTVKFDIRRVRNGSRGLYSLLSFIAYQLLVLTEIQNKVGNKNYLGDTFKETGVKLD